MYEENFSKQILRIVKTSLSAEGLNYCNRLFQLEQEWDCLPVEERYQKRQEEMKPIMDEFLIGVASIRYYRVVN